MARKRKYKKNYYFTQVHEDAIVKWCDTDTPQDERERLFKNIINPVLNELIEKIVFTYKFTSLPNIDILREDCKAYVTTVLTKYDPDRGSSAFTYFSVVTKHWFIQQVKKTKKRFDREVNLDDVIEVRRHVFNMAVTNDYEQKRADKEFWDALMAEIDGWSNLNLRENERKVVNAIKVLIDSREQIEIFNKKAIYLYLREISGLNTKQIVNSLVKIRERYRNFKKGWINE